jgi:hypothetical protein
MTSPQSITSSSTIFSSGIVSPDHLTPDGMVIYLQTRLGSLDDQINTIMNKQKASESARKALQAIQNEMANVGEEGGTVNLDVYAKTLNDITQSMGPKAAAELLASFPQSIQDQLELTPATNDASGPNVDVYQATSDTVKLSKEDVTATKTYIENAIKDVESGSELEMIKLQSLMSARNTAISLATNMMSAIGKGAEAIVGNIGR